MKKKLFDVIVIGAGSGALAFAKKASLLGQKCALIEEKKVGGTCVNVGCVPKKIMWFAAQSIHFHHLLTGFGFNDTSCGKLDYQKLVNQREGYIHKVHQSYTRQFENYQISLIKGRAHFHSPNEVMVGDETYQAKTIVIATGSKAFIPKIEGFNLAMDSDGFFAMNHLPKKIAIIGAGYIALEVAGVLQSLGTKVSVFVRSDILLRGFDRDIANRLIEHMRAAGVKFHFNCQPQALRKNQKDKSLLDLIASSDKVYEGFDKVMFATSRKANLSGLNLELAQIQTDQNNKLIVNEKFQTTNKNVYALGDVLDGIQLTPYAIRQAKNLAEHLFNHQPFQTIDDNTVASVVFTHPAIGMIGLTKEQAEKKYQKVKEYRSSFNPMVESFAPYKQSALMKLICVGDEERVVGMHSIGFASDEMMQGFAVAMKMGATKKDFDYTIAIHPTSAEEFVTMQ